MEISQKNNIVQMKKKSAIHTTNAKKSTFNCTINGNALRHRDLMLKSHSTVLCVRLAYQTHCTCNKNFELSQKCCTTGGNVVDEEWKFLISVMTKWFIAFSELLNDPRQINGCPAGGGDRVTIENETKLITYTVWVYDINPNNMDSTGRKLFFLHGIAAEA